MGSGGSWAGRTGIPVQALFFWAVLLLLQSCSLLDGVPNLTAEEVRKLIEGPSPALIVDTRTEIEFAHGRLPGAKLITEHQFDQLASLLPKDKDRTLVFYCRGYG